MKKEKQQGWIGWMLGIFVAVLIIMGVFFWKFVPNNKSALETIPLQTLDRVAQVMVTVLLIAVTIIVFGIPIWSQGEEIIGKGQLRKMLVFAIISSSVILVFTLVTMVFAGPNNSLQYYQLILAAVAISLSVFPIFLTIYPIFRMLNNASYKGDDLVICRPTAVECKKSKDYSVLISSFYNKLPTTLRSGY